MSDKMVHLVEKINDAVIDFIMERGGNVEQCFN